MLARLDTLPKDSRPFTAHQLAEVLVGREHAAIVAAHKLADAAFQRAILRNRELTRGQSSPASKIASGLAALSAEKAADRAKPKPQPTFKGA